MLTIRLLPEAVYAGASPHASDPVIVVSLDLAQIGPDSLRMLDAGAQALRIAFPDWLPAAPSPQTALAQSLGQTAVNWALAALNEIRGFLHEAGAETTARGVRLWLGYHHPGVSFAALDLAFRLIRQAGEEGALDRETVGAQLDALWRDCRRHHPDSESHILMAAARKRNIPVLRFHPEVKLWQYGWGSCSRIYFESLSSDDSAIGHRLQHSKPIGKSLLLQLGFPTPAHIMVTDPAALPSAADQIGWPCVVKPLAMGSGKGVTANIRDMAGLNDAFVFARRYGEKAVMVESHVPGDDYRLMVIHGCYYAAIRRDPPAVIGDGRRSLADLIADLNCARGQNIVRSGYLRPVSVDSSLAAHLTQQNLSLDVIPAEGRRVMLRSNANWSTGGTCMDVTQDVHPHLRQMAEALAATLGLAALGLDFITTDIRKSWQEEGAVIEFNSTPGLSVMAAGGIDPLALGTAILGPGPGRIPVHLLLLAPETVEDTLGQARRHTWSVGVGWSCGSEAMIDGLPLGCGSPEPWAGFQALIRQRAVTRIVVLATVKDIVRHGLPADRVEQVAFCGAEPKIPDVWARLLGEASHSVVRFADLGEFAASLA